MHRSQYSIMHTEDGCQLQQAEAPLVLLESLLKLLLLLASNSDSLCFSAHSGSNLLPEPGVIVDAGSLIAMVVKEVVVISSPLFGGVMAIVQLVSVTAGGTQKRYDNSIKLEWNTINLEEWSVRNKEIK